MTMTDQTIVNFLTIVKGKPLSDWSLTELEYFTDEIATLYRYCHKDSCASLEYVYIKIVEWVNDKRGFIRYSKHYLSKIKREV